MCYFAHMKELTVLSLDYWIFIQYIYKKIFTEPLLGSGCLENTANESQLPVLSFNHLIIYSSIQVFEPLLPSDCLENTASK